YDYNSAGAKVGKRLYVTRVIGGSSPTAVLEADYTYDTEGRMTAIQYPNSQAVVSGNGVTTTGPPPGTAYASMGRPSTLPDLVTSSALISGTTYGPSNELLSLSGQITESRTYNSLVQLTSIYSYNTSGTSAWYNYAYSATQNNGKLISQTD